MTALVVARKPNAMMAVSLKHVNFDIIDKVAAALSGQGNRMPGELLSFKKGIFYVGTGPTEKRAKLKHGTELVANVPNLVLYWQKFADGVPQMEGLCYPLIGEVPAARDTLGDTDESKWEISRDEKGKPEFDSRTGEPKRNDPWNLVTSLIMRDADDNLYRFETVSYSGKTAVGQFVGEWSKEAKRHGPNELPIIELGSDLKTRKGSKDTYAIPTFTITGWVEATEIDFPEGGVAISGPAPAATDDDEGGTVATQRVTKKPAAPKAEPKPEPEPEVKAASKFAKARAEATDVEVVEDDVPAASSFGSKFKKKAA